MRCAGTLPSIKNVRGRSPRPICVMTSSTCCHGAIHLRQTIKAMQPNATQIRTMTNQVTAFLFSSKYFSQQSGCEDVSQSQTTSCRILVRHEIPFVAFKLWSAGVRSLARALTRLQHADSFVTIRGADSRNRARFQSRRRLCRVFRAVGARACPRCGCRSRFRSPRRR